MKRRRYDRPEGLWIQRPQILSSKMLKGTSSAMTEL
eukprot:COSAG01_NODE_58159_length_307_cov_4.062500_2_plen_35_part_01